MENSSSALPRAHRKRLGKFGEQFAVHALTERGYHVLVTNWRYGRIGELDIVALSPIGMSRSELSTGVSRISLQGAHAPDSRLPNVADTANSANAQTLVFIEVKTRNGQSFGSALEAVTVRQQRQLALLAEAFVSEHPQYSKHAWRFDLVCVTPDQMKNHWQLEHVTDILSE